METRKPTLLSNEDERVQVFLDFVLSHYVALGVSELDEEKLGGLRPSALTIRCLRKLRRRHLVNGPLRLATS